MAKDDDPTSPEYPGGERQLSVRNSETARHQSASPDFPEMFRELQRQRDLEQTATQRERDTILWQDYLDDKQKRVDRKKAVKATFYFVLGGIVFASTPPLWLVWMLDVWKRLWAVKP